MKIKKKFGGFKNMIGYMRGVHIINDTSARKKWYR